MKHVLRDYFFFTVGCASIRLPGRLPGCQLEEVPWLLN